MAPPKAPRARCRTVVTSAWARKGRSPVSPVGDPCFDCGSPWAPADLTESVFVPCCLSSSPKEGRNMNRGLQHSQLELSCARGCGKSKRSWEESALHSDSGLGQNTENHLNLSGSFICE